MNYRYLLTLILVSLTLTGCWDRREINDVAFVAGSAIDREKDKYLATIQIALPSQLGGAGSKGGGGGTSGEKTYHMLSMYGNTIREANLKEQQMVSRQLYFAHRRTILIGEELAKEGIEPIMDVLGRIPQNRLTSYMIITKGPARKVLSTEAPIEQFPSEMIRELTVEYMKKPRSIKHVINIMLTNGIDLALPVASTITTKNEEKEGEKKSIKVGGLAVFKDNKLAGYLKEDEAQGALWAMGELSKPEIILNSPRGKGKLIVQFQETDTKLTPYIKGNDITIKIQVRGKGIIVENESNFQATANENLTLVEKTLAKKISSEIEKTVSVLQTKYESDPIGFGKLIHDNKPKEWKRFNKNWEKIYRTVKIQVEPIITIEHTGAAITPLGRKDKQIVE